MIIRFITSADFVSDAIRAVTFSEWSHVEMLDPLSNEWIGAHDDGGVQSRAFDYCKVSRERRYDVPLFDSRETTALIYARSKIGTKYDFVDIAGLLLHHDLTTKGRAICSTFVFDVLNQGGWQMLNVLPNYENLVTPESLHLSPYLIGRCVYSYPLTQSQIA